MIRTGFIVAVESYLVRKGLVTVLNRIPGVSVIREFNAVSPLMEFMKERNRDLLVISQALFDESTEWFISGAWPLEKTILLTDGKKTGEDHKPENGPLSIDTENNKEVLLKKIRDFLDAQPIKPGEQEISQLSRRERTIVRLLSLGYTNKQIAQELFLSAHTVITHRKNIIQKLGIKSVSGLTVYAIVNNIITIEEVNSFPDQ